MLPRRLRFRQTTLLMAGCAAFLLGLGAARWVYVDGLVLAVVLGVAAVLLFRKRSVASLACLVLCGMLLGFWRGNGYLLNEAAYQALMKQPVVIEAVATSDAVYGDRSQLSFTASQVLVTDPEEVALKGSLRVEGFGVPMVYKGDRVLITGKLYPTLGSNQAKISFAQLAVTAPGDSAIDKLRRRFVAGLQSVLPEPAASFGAGLLIGQRSTLPQETSDQLSVTGLTHLVAVSGYNLTILVGAAWRLLGKRSKFQSVACSVVLVGLFVLMTGLSASIVRAAIVSMLSLAAWYYGRRFRPVLLLLVTAVLTAAWNPFYLWSDIGWYLSFLAFFGVLVLAPLLGRRLSRTGKVRPLMSILLECFAAQLMTLPIIMYTFGRVSVIGMVANVLVVPLVPLAMFAVLLAGVAGMLLPLYGGWIAWPAQTVLTYMLDVVGVLSRLPRASVEQSVRLWQMLTLYGMIVLCAVVLGHKTAAKTGIITDEAGEY